LFDGCCLILDQGGNVLAEGAAFTEDLVVADVDLDEVFNARLHDTRLRKERSLDDGEPLPRIHLDQFGTVSAPGSGVATITKPALAERPARVEQSVEAEVYAALTLGVHDYVTK